MASLRDGAVKRDELLVEKGAQALKLVRLAQLLGIDDLVIGAGEYLVAEGLGVIEHREIRPPGLRPARLLGLVGAVEKVRHSVVAVVERLVARNFFFAGVRRKFGALLAFRLVLFGIGSDAVGFGLLLGFLFRPLFELIGEVELGK